jgi:hypothetical protein
VTTGSTLSFSGCSADPQDALNPFSNAGSLNYLKVTSGEDNHYTDDMQRALQYLPQKQAESFTGRRLRHFRLYLRERGT